MDVRRGIQEELGLFDCNVSEDFGFLRIEHFQGNLSLSFLKANFHQVENVEADDIFHAESSMNSTKKLSLRNC